MRRRRRLSIALVHHPVLDAKGEVVASTLTTMDVHDLSRSARTYGCEALYLVHPIEAQRALAHKIVEHWTHGSSAKRIPDRKDALAVVRVVSTLDEAVAHYSSVEAVGPLPSGARGAVKVWATAARAMADKRVLAWAQARAEMTKKSDDDDNDAAPILLLFGTSWGLAPEVIDRADALLEPIVGVGEWNHLSVRSACAIALDRLCGPEAR